MRIESILAGKRVKLVPYLREHVSRYTSWMQDDELLRLTGSERLSEEEEYANQQSWHSDPTKATFIICASDTAGPDDDLTLGMCGDVNAFLSEIDDEDEAAEEGNITKGCSAEIEIMIAETSYRRNGFARESLLLFFHWLFQTVPNIRRLVVKINDDNAPSFRLFESLGFTLHRRMAVFEQTELRWDVLTAREMAQQHWTEVSAAMLAAPSSMPMLRVLVLTYEFTFSPFSGNGVLTRSLVKGLLGQEAMVHVVCCKPTADVNATSTYSSDLPIQAPEVDAVHAAALSVQPVTLAARAGWRRLDRSAAWSAFAESAAGLASTIAREFRPSAVLAIDWTGGAAWRAMRAVWPVDSTLSPPPPSLYINFRVYSSGLPAGDPEAAWYDARELEALRAAQHVLALSVKDRTSLHAMLSASAPASLPTVDAPASLPTVEVPASLPTVEVLLPCLRGDLHALAEQPLAAHQRHQPPAVASVLAAMSNRTCAAQGVAGSDGRFLVTCAVRLSAEKNPLLFVEVMEAIGHHLEAKGLLPLLCGATADASLAREIKERLRAAVPSAVVLDDFLGPEALGSVLSATRLNFHPCLYDAYGMSVVEAAAFGAPSVVNGGGSVGATALLNPDGVGTAEQGCFELDLRSSSIAELGHAVLAALDDEPRLQSVAQTAKERALGWSEAAAGRAIYDRLQQLRSQHA